LRLSDVERREHLPSRRDLRLEISSIIPGIVIILRLTRNWSSDWINRHAGLRLLNHGRRLESLPKQPASLLHLLKLKRIDLGEWVKSEHQLVAFS
jgi:hypothetical protein